MIIDSQSPDILIRSSQEKMAFVVNEATLNTAIENHHFKLHYQPQIDLSTGKVFGLEGLLRWRHPEFGIKLPETFISIAEQTGQIEQLTHLVIDTGLRFIEKLGTGLSFSLNISAQSIKDDHLINTLDHSCHQFHIDPHRVILEFAQSETLEHTALHSENILTQLKTNGFRLAIDDSGADYSSMTPLAESPFSELKIDKSLVTTMELSSQSRKSISSRIKLADSLGIVTIAEGIENDLEAIGLRELGCQLGQGHYFAKPMNEADTLIWLENWNRNLGLPI